MIISIASWLVALTTALLPRGQKQTAFIAMMAAVIVSLGASGWLIYEAPSQYIAGKDRELYEQLYNRLQWSNFSFDFEPGYAFLQIFANSIGLSAQWFFTTAATFVTISLWFFLRNRYRTTDALLLLFLILNFFPFLQGALNVSRQFIAAGVLLLAFLPVQRACATRMNDFKALGTAIVLVFVAAMFHRSAILCLIPLGLIWLGTRTLGLIALGSAFFALNLLGVGQSLWGSLLEVDRNLAENLWSFERGEIGLVYSGGINRLDFVLFSLFPVAAHYFVAKLIRVGNRTDDSLALFYCWLLFPFFMFSFLPFSDRLAFYAWLIWPAALCDAALLATAYAARVYLFLVCGAIGAIALFKLYGATATEVVQLLLP